MPSAIENCARAISTAIPLALQRTISVALLEKCPPIYFGNLLKISFCWLSFLFSVCFAASVFFFSALYTMKDARIFSTCRLQCTRTALGFFLLRCAHFRVAFVILRVHFLHPVCCVSARCSHFVFQLTKTIKL